jgi:hypothetical protein
MSATKTASRPRGRPPKNAKPPMGPALHEAIAGQAHAEAEKENSVVLSIITSANKHQDYFCSEEDGDETYSEFYRVSFWILVPKTLLYKKTFLESASKTVFLNFFYKEITHKDF